MRTRFRPAFVISALVLFAVFTFAEEASVLTPEDVESLKTIGSVAISPDGKFIAYTLSVPRAIDEASGGSYSELWVIPFEGGKAKAFATGKGRVGSPAWSPDGKHLSFTTNKGEGTQVYGMPLKGGEARQLTHSSTSVRSYRWNFDGTKIAYLTQDDYSKEEKKDRKAGRDQQEIEVRYRFTRLVVLDLKSGEARHVTPPDYNVWSFNWSPDGKQFVITASDIATTDASYMFRKLYIVDAEDGSRKPLCETAGKLGTPVWSPDGTMIAWNGAVDMSDASMSSVFVCKIAEGKAINLTNEAIYTASNVQWFDNSTLAVSALKFQDMILFTMSTDGSGVEQLLGPGPIFGTPSFSKDKSRLACRASTPMHPNELFSGEVGGAIKRLTDSNPQLAGFKLGKQEVVKWKAEDGLDLEGVLIYPVNYKEGESYPLIVQPHGGPESAYLNGWNTSYSRWSQMLAGKGYVVFAPNYRASIGRGVAFAKADHNDLGGKEFQDVIDGVKHLINIGLVDGERVGSGGGSYGGYFSALAATKGSEYFAAAVVFAGITNWYSFQGTTDISIENSLTHWNIPDWHMHPEILWKASPVAHIGKANTPTLVAHGERDLRVPLGQGQELFRNLKFKGTPVEMVVYPRAGHGLGESQHRLDYAKRVLKWFDKWVKNKPVSKDKLD